MGYEILLSRGFHNRAKWAGWNRGAECIIKDYKLIFSKIEYGCKTWGVVFVIGVLQIAV